MEATFVLLVEDDVAISEILCEELTDARFNVVAAYSGIEAIAELDANEGRFRAVITDIRLGYGPDGWEVGRRARELIRNIPIVFISGDSAHEWSAKGLMNTEMIAKPFSPARLIAVLSALLPPIGY